MEELDPIMPGGFSFAHSKTSEGSTPGKLLRLELLYALLSGLTSHTFALVSFSLLLSSCLSISNYRYLRASPPRWDCNLPRFILPETRVQDPGNLIDWFIIHEGRAETKRASVYRKDVGLYLTQRTQQ